MEARLDGGEFVLLGDRPHAGDNDPLGFDGIVEDLARLIRDSRGSTPFTLGIEAAWGMGKSTLMNRLHARLAREEGVTPVMFNAWTADDGGVLEGLVKTVLNELDPNALRRGLRSEKLIGGLRALAIVLGGLLGLGNVVDLFWSRVASDPRARNDLRKLVGEAVADWRDKEARMAEDRLLCVFVDDLDRCSPRGVLNVFEAMKLYLDVPGLVFVVGYDQDIVSDLVLREKGYSSEAIESRDYLEKFIQIVYRIPRPIPECSAALVESLLETSRTGELFGSTERAIVIEGSASNPRRIKRFVNAFVLAYGLDSRWREFEPQALVRLQLLQMYFPGFARILEAPAERDPVEEFLTYKAARDVLRRGGRDDWGAVERALKGYELPIPAPGVEPDFDAIRSSLDENVPTDFGPYLDSADFLALISSLAKASDWPALRTALVEGVLPLERADAEEEEASDTRPRFPLVGLHVLWIDDEMERNEVFTERLWKWGATFSTASDASEAVAPLRTGEVDVLISDITREGDPEAGFEELEWLRTKVPEMPPVVFFTSRVTEARRRRARELGAAITNDSNELFDLLALRARQFRTKEGFSS